MSKIGEAVKEAVEYIENSPQHAVRTYNLSGKFINEHFFYTADEAYQEYLDIQADLHSEKI